MTCSLPPALKLGVLAGGGVGGLPSNCTVAAAPDDPIPHIPISLNYNYNIPRAPVQSLRLTHASDSAFC